MLPAYPDCPRRGAAKQYRRLVEDAGFELRPLLPSVGSAIGTAAHAALAHMLTEKMRTGEPGRLDDGLEVAMSGFHEEIAPGAEWDDTSPNLQTAEIQIRRLAECLQVLAITEDPVLVEAELRATVAPGWELTGHLDLMTRPGVIIDAKTGALKRPYQAQLGGYSLLVRSQPAGTLPEVTGIGIAFAQRARKTKPQPPLERQTYDIAVAEGAAYATVQRIVRDVEEFEKTGSPEAFPANPLSLMCSKKYCPAWGTTFCRMHADLKHATPDSVD